MKWLDGVFDSMCMNLGKLWEIVNDRGAWCAAIHGVARSQTGLSDWTTIKEIRKRKYQYFSLDVVITVGDAWLCSSPLAVLRRDIPILGSADQKDRKSLRGCP